jgi:hypothetical protein
MPIKLSGSPLKLMRPNTDAEEAQYRVARDREISTARGVNDLTVAFAQIANVGAKYQEQERLNYVNKTKIRALEEGNQFADEWGRGLTGEKPLDQVPHLKNGLDKIRIKLLADAPDDQAREAADMQLSLLNSTLVREGGKLAHKVHTEYSAGMWNAAMNEGRKSAYQAGLKGGGPADLITFIDDVDIATDAQVKAGYWLDPITADKAKRTAKSQRTQSFVKGALDSGDDAIIMRTVNDLRAGRYNSLDPDALETLGHAARAELKRMKSEREAASHRAQALAEDTAASDALKQALSKTSRMGQPDYGAAAELLMSPDVKTSLKGYSDKALSRAASFAVSNYHFQKNRDSERQKNVDDSVTAQLEGLRLKSELTHEAVQKMADAGASPKMLVDWHNVVEAEANNNNVRNASVSSKIAEGIMSKINTGEITRISEISPFRAQGLQDKEFNAVIKHFNGVKKDEDEPYIKQTFDYLKGISKTKEDGTENKTGILGPTDVVRINSILHSEHEAGKLEAKDMLKRAQELTDVVYTEQFFKSDRPVRRFEVEPGGTLPATKKGIEDRQEALDLLRTGNDEERALYNSLYGDKPQQAQQQAPQTPSVTASTQQGAQYKTKAEVKAAYKAGKLTESQATEIIMSNGLQ